MYETKWPFSPIVLMLVACGGTGVLEPDAGTETDGGKSPPSQKCGELAPLPVTATVLKGFTGFGSEDFAFDGEGNLVSV